MENIHSQPVLLSCRSAFRAPVVSGTTTLAFSLASWGYMVSHEHTQQFATEEPPGTLSYPLAVATPLWRHAVTSTILGLRIRPRVRARPSSSVLYIFQ